MAQTKCEDPSTRLRSLRMTRFSKHFSANCSRLTPYCGSVKMRNPKRCVHTFSRAAFAMTSARLWLPLKQGELASVASLRGFIRSIPQSASLTAPFTQGGLFRAPTPNSSLPTANCCATGELAVFAAYVRTKSTAAHLWGKKAPLPRINGRGLLILL